MSVERVEKVEEENKGDMSTRREREVLGDKKKD